MEQHVDVGTGLAIRRVPLSSLHLDPANARTHGNENLCAIEASLRRFGQAEPLVVHKRTGRVIGGNGRLVAMRKLGWQDCDVVELDIDDLTATALGIALNRTSELAEWDPEALGRLLRQLQEEDALDGVGFDQAAIDELLAGLPEIDGLENEVEDPGPGPLPDEPVTRSGDLWLLGSHKLICADAREPSTYERLLAGELIDLVWTDPPFGVSYVGKTKDALEIQNDDLDQGELEEFLRVSFSAACAVCRPGAVWYVAAPAGPNFLPFAKVLADLGIWRQTLVWLKDAFVLGRSDFHYRHEALFYGWKPGAAHHAPPSRDMDTIWEVARPKASPDHPTMKPVELVTRSILTSSDPKAIVLDIYSGSGTTILAAELTGRMARAADVDARYCDSAVKRWQKATGRKAVLDGEGRTFAEIAEVRSSNDEDPR